MPPLPPPIKSPSPQPYPAASPPAISQSPTPSPAASRPVLRPPSGPKAAARPAKTFSITPYSASTGGQKILIYGKTGSGKTTLASLAPNPVFLALDDGSRNIHVPTVPGLESFDDVRDALHQKGLFADDATIVIDTVTKLEADLEPWVYANYPLKGGAKATSMRAYGWDGPAHLLDGIRLLLSDLDAHIRAGRNVLLLAQTSQIRVPNAEGLDYLEDGPKLQHNNQYSGRTEVCEWCDHVLRIGYQNFEVRADSDKATKGKVTGDLSRAIFSGGAAHYVAKSRPVDGKRLPPVISFENEADDSLWQMLFHGAIPNA